LREKPRFAFGNKQLVTTRLAFAVCGKTGGALKGRKACAER
jgi:hypothetical protein